MLTKTGDERKITAVYAAQPAEAHHRGAQRARDRRRDRGVHHRRLRPGLRPQHPARRRGHQRHDRQAGETFSLNGATEPRNESNGYVEAGIISEGHASRGVGGGVSQVATTLYNAAYFAGMTDVTHKPHSFYISRYPPGREATVFEGAIDMKFRNDAPDRRA